MLCCRKPVDFPAFERIDSTTDVVNYMFGVFTLLSKFIIHYRRYNYG
jgi:hypothetical protein